MPVKDRGVDMATRSEGRKMAWQVLNAMDLMRVIPSDEAIVLQLKEIGLSKDIEGFVYDIVGGVLDQKDEIDIEIIEHLRGVSLMELSPADRSILRIAVYELLEKDLDKPIVAKESLKLSDSFSTTEGAGKFIQAVITSIAKKHGKEPK